MDIIIELTKASEFGCYYDKGGTIPDNCSCSSCIATRVLSHLFDMENDPRQANADFFDKIYNANRNLCAKRKRR